MHSSHPRYLTHSPDSVHRRPPVAHTKPVVLYNVMFPIWFFFLLPTYLWLILLPANFAIDSLVLLVAVTAYHYRSNIKESLTIWKSSILKIWLIGFASDFVGAALIFALYTLLEPRLSINLVLFPWTTLLTIPGVLLAGGLIYRLNRRFSFGRCALDPKQIRKLSLTLAVCTAPYTMLIPLYG